MQYLMYLVSGGLSMIYNSKYCDKQMVIHNEYRYNS